MLNSKQIVILVFIAASNVTSQMYIIVPLVLKCAFLPAVFIFLSLPWQRCKCVEAFWTRFTEKPRSDSSPARQVYRAASKSPSIRIMQPERWHTLAASSKEHTLQKRRPNQHNSKRQSKVIYDGFIISLAWLLFWKISVLDVLGNRIWKLHRGSVFNFSGLFFLPVETTKL